MSRFFSTLACVVALAGHISSAASAEVMRYDFVQKLGEGGVAIYRLEVDPKGEMGRFCFAGSWGAGIDMSVRDRIYNGEPWSRLLDLSKVEHACAIIRIYGAYGPFYTPTMTLGSHRYVFVFTGDFDGGKMSGEMLIFGALSTGEKNDVIRFVDRFDIDAIGTRAGR